VNLYHIIIKYFFTAMSYVVVIKGGQLLCEVKMKLGRQPEDVNNHNCYYKRHFMKLKFCGRNNEMSHSKSIILFQIQCRERKQE